MYRLALLAGPLLSLSLGCGGMAPTDGAESLIGQTTAGKHRCVSAGDEHKLFVVEWDGTDASTFQARAARDVVFVAYADCQLRVIDGCSDGSLAGRYGSYRDPVMTSGATESFTVTTKDELDAKLPLGAVSLGAELTSDRALELTYYVSGTTLATRDEVYRNELMQSPRCSEATHVVVAYNLGAFALNTKDRKEAGADAAFKGAGISGKHGQRRDSVRKAGDIAACTKVDNHACRVPIRLTLRPIRPGGPPAATSPVTMTPGMPPNLAGVNNQTNAVMIESSAQQKYMVHDGKGCLADLDKADATDPQGKERRLDLRARCTMRAGRCEAGKALYKQARVAWHRKYDKTDLASDASIDAQVEQVAKMECATKRGGGRSVHNHQLGLLQKIVQASQSGDADACVKLGAELSKLAEGDRGKPNQMAAAGLGQAARCAAKGGRCKEAKPLYFDSLRFMTPDMSEDSLASAWKLNVKDCHK